MPPHAASRQLPSAAGFFSEMTQPPAGAGELQCRARCPDLRGALWGSGSSQRIGRPSCQRLASRPCGVLPQRAPAVRDVGERADFDPIHDHYSAATKSRTGDRLESVLVLARDASDQGFDLREFLREDEAVGKIGLALSRIFVPGGASATPTRFALFLQLRLR